MLIAPPEIIGREMAASPYKETIPRRWSRSEVEWCLARRSEGFSAKEIGEAVGRSELSIKHKLKREGKSNGSYNANYRRIKFAANELLIERVGPHSVLDAFAGNSWWKDKVVECISNDIDKSFDNDYQLDAFDLLCRLYVEGRSFDVIDLDPFGSAYECFDFAFRMAKKGVIISFGEWGHKRWKRYDFVGPRYGIHGIEDFEPEFFIAEAQRIARLHKKRADVIKVVQYNNFLRVYFELSSHREISQWQKF